MCATRSTFSQAGFTLLELVIAVAVLLTALMAVLGVFLGLRAMNEAAHHETIGINMADRIFEEIRQSDFQTKIVPNAQAPTDAAWVAWAGVHGVDLTEPGLGGETVDFDPPCEGGGDEEPGFPCTGSEDPLRIQVRVKWVERNNRARVTYVESLVTDRK